MPASEAFQRCIRIVQQNICLSAVSIALIFLLLPGQPVCAAEIKTKDARPVPPIPAADDDVPILQVIHDPLEPFNRIMGYCNHAIMRGIIGPARIPYDFVLSESVCRAVQRCAHNLEFPSRLLNNLLQGKWRGAGTEARRFFANTTLGCLGLFDPATRLGISACQASSQAAGVAPEHFKAEADTANSRYVLRVEFADRPGEEAMRSFLQQFDATLMNINVEYRAKRDSLRLSPPVLHVMREGWHERNRQRMVLGGHRMFQAKTEVLSPVKQKTEAVRPELVKIIELT